jgi:alkyldihydroxyacetonephosphate synthase
MQRSSGEKKMKRQKKFYAWGYADEDLTPEEIKPWEADIARRYGVSAFDVTPPPRADEITLRAPRVTVPAALQAIVRTDHLTRLEHSYGKAGFDTCRMFMRSVPNPPDAVAFPESEQDVVRVLDWCDQIGAKAIPYGGGSSVVKGIEPAASFEKVVTISMRQMDKVLEVDPVSQAARIQGGVYGPHIEEQLRDTPFTMRHYMQAYRCSTLGGWIATRSGGHYATLYTHIDDFVESTRVVTPSGTLETRRLPGSGAGPSPDRMFIGSEGILGIITEAWMRLRKKPGFRAATSVRFKDFYAGAEAVRGITQAGLYPANCRLLEAREALPCIPWDNEEAVLMLTFESSDHPLDAWMDRALEICRDFGGVPDAAALEDENSHRSGAAGAWRNKFIRAPHYSEHAVARGILSSTFETSMTWERFRDFHGKITKITRDTIKRVTGRDGTVTCRFTHVYPDGPCLYFTFGGLLDKRIMLDQFMEVLTTCTAATVEHGGTTTHHHAVGRFHRPFYDKQRPELFARALRGAKRELDPKGMLNPGVLIDP